MRQWPKRNLDDAPKDLARRRVVTTGLAAALAAALKGTKAEAAGNALQQWPDFPLVITPERPPKERESWIDGQIRQYRTHLRENSYDIQHGTPQQALELLHTKQPYIDEKLTHGVEKYDIRELIEKFCFMAVWVPGESTGKKHLKLIPPGKAFDADRRTAAKQFPHCNAFFITPTVMLVASHAFLDFNPSGKVGHQLLASDIAIVQVPKKLAQWDRVVPVDYTLRNKDLEGRFVAFGGYDIDQWANDDGTKIYAGVFAPQDNPAAKAYAASADLPAHFNAKTMAIRLPHGAARKQVDRTSGTATIPGKGMSSSAGFVKSPNTGGWVVGAVFSAVSQPRTSKGIIDVGVATPIDSIRKMLDHPEHDYSNSNVSLIQPGELATLAGRYTRRS